jgi:hypothetical protein
MKKIIISILVAVVLMIVISFLIFNNNGIGLSKKNDSYMLYLSNTNFPVLFADGNWTDELKQFVIKDLNCLYHSSEYIRDYRCNSSEVTINNSILISTNKISLRGRFCPLGFQNPFDYSFGNIISINADDYLYASTNLMYIYEEKLKTCNIDDNFHNKVVNFVSGIKDMSIAELRNKILVVDEYGKSFNSVESSIVINGCKQVIDWFDQNYKDVSFSALYFREGVDLNQLGSGIKYVPDDSLILYMQMMMRNSRRGVDRSDIHLIYIGGEFKYFMMVYGE